MYKQSIFHMIRVGLLIFATTSLHAATVFVTNLLDDVSPGSLRETIANASGLDTIQFNVAGTIVLDEALGELVVDKQLTIDGQYKIAVDGANLINVCFHITGASSSNTIIQNITIQNFNGHAVNPGSGTEAQELPAYGILIDTNAIDCSVFNTTITAINSGQSQEAAGIKSSEDTEDLLGNSINTISSDGGNFGNVFGITTRDSNNINNNTIVYLTSGASNLATGSVEGIACASVTAINNNTVAHLYSGASLSSLSGPVFGIAGGIITTVNNNSIMNLASGTSNATSASAEAIILFRVDTISNNKISDISSGNAQDSGDVFGIHINNNISSDCLHNSISTLASGTASDSSGFVRGIFVTQNMLGNCADNAISYLTGGQAGNNSQAVTGILIRNTLGGDCTRNTILHLTSGDAGTISGIVGGIFGDGTFSGNLSNNTIQYLTTGAAGSVEQHAMGVFVNHIEGDCLNNLVSDITITGAITIERSGGIRFSLVDDDGLLACNTIHRITGGEDGRTFAIEVEQGNNLIIRNNTIESITNIQDAAHGIFLGSDAGTAGLTFVTNSLISFNTISNIIGDNLNGFGITLFGIGTDGGSTGNDLLNNGIFMINGKAINIIDNGLPVDATVTLESAVCGTQCVFIRGTLAPELGFETAEFLLQFFVSTKNTPPQAQTFLGQTTITALFSTPFTVKIVPCIVIDENHYITATATALPPGTEPNNNTSEVSNAIPGCSNDFVCSVATTTCNLEPPPCPIFIAQ